MISNSCEIDFIWEYILLFLHPFIRAHPVHPKHYKLPLNDITAFYGTANDVIIASKNLSFGLMAGNEYKFDNEIAIFGSHLEEHTHTHTFHCRGVEQMKNMRDSESFILI